MSLARRAAQAYVDAVASDDLDGIVGLFAPGAVLQNQTGRYEGLDAIRGFYDMIVAARVRPTVERILDDGPVAVLQMSAVSALGDPEQRAHAVDVFTVDDDGKVISLDIYFR
jgi:hypothetical protein